MVEVQIRGKVRKVPEKQAKVLVSIGRATYMTKDIVPAPVVQEVFEVEVPEVEEDAPKKRGRPRKVKDEE